MYTVTLQRRWLNLGVFVIFLALAVAGYSVTHTFPSPLLPGYPGSAMFPRLALIAMGVISTFGILRVVLTGGGAAAQGAITLPIGAFLSVVGLLIGFTVVLDVAGMEVAVFCLIAGCLWFRTRRVVLPAIAGVLAVAVVYLVFVQALSVGLPLLILPRYMMGY